MTEKLCVAHHDGIAFAFPWIVGRPNASAAASFADQSSAHKFAAADLLIEAMAVTELWLTNKPAPWECEECPRPHTAWCSHNMKRAVELRRAALAAARVPEEA